MEVPEGERPAVGVPPPRGFCAVQVEKLGQVCQVWLGFSRDPVACVCRWGSSKAG